MDELHHKPRLNSHKPGFFGNFFASLKGINRTNWMWKKDESTEKLFRKLNIKGKANVSPFGQLFIFLFW